jgi:predicted patatin/cPLA2 family phospholipase
MKKGLILEGGAMRGMFTAGVMDVMMEHNIKFDGAVGVSAGAAFGCNYKSHQIGRVIRYNTRFCNDKRYSGLHCLLKNGNIYSTDFCYGEVPLKYDPFDFETYRSDPMEFYVVCTDLDTGKAVYHKYEGTEKSGFDWVRASASMPLVSQIVEIDGQKLLDGGMADSIPVKFFQRMGYDKNVVVLTQPKGFVKKKNRLMPMIRRKYKDYPKMVQAMANRHRVYNETLKYVEQRERAGELFVLRPEKKLPVSRVEKNPDHLTEAYNIGRAAVSARLDELERFWGES